MEQEHMELPVEALDLQTARKVFTCLWCPMTWPAHTPQHVLGEHMMECERHPLAMAVRTLERIRSGQVSPQKAQRCASGALVAIRQRSMELGFHG